MVLQLLSFQIQKVEPYSRTCGPLFRYIQYCTKDFSVSWILVNVEMKTMISNLVQFCQQTTLHGWSYIVNEEGIFSKLLWIVAQIVFVTFASFLMTSNFLVYFNSTTKTSLESTISSLDDLAFPGIFICNNNQVKASFLSQLTNYNKSWSSSLKEKVKKSFNRQFIHGNDEKDEKLASLVKEALERKFNWTEMIPIKEISAPK